MNVDVPAADLPSSSSPERSVAVVKPSPTWTERVVALFEVLLCSDYPTQMVLAFWFASLGFHATDANGQLNLEFVVWLSLVDAVVLVVLMLTLLLAHGERPRDVFLGSRPILGEARAGIPMTFAAFAVALVVLLGVRALAPWLHTVEHNPLQDLIHSPADAALFAMVVIVAGGVREELQRAFVLHRFERSLGGGTTGVIVGSIAFGAGHFIQGADAAIATGILGAFWGVVYLRRRSVIAPMVSHAGFDLLQLLQLVAIGR